MSFNAEKQISREAPVGPARTPVATSLREARCARGICAGRVDAASSPRRVKLGEVCGVVSVPSSNTERTWLLNLDMVEQQTGRVIQKLIVDVKDVGSSTVAFDDTCVLYSKLRPNLNKVVLPDEPGVATSELLVLKTDDELDRSYLGWFLRSPTFVGYAVSKTAGAKMPRLGTKQLFEAQIPLPSLPAQREIAAELDRICELKRTAEKLVEKLQLLVKSRFVEMFGEGAIPTSRLGDFCGVGSGKRVFAEEFKMTGIPFFRGTEISALAKKEYEEPLYYISEEHYRALASHTGVPKVGDLLLPSICMEGLVWKVDINTPFYFKDGRVLWVSVPSSVDSEYLRFALSTVLRRDYNKIASGTTFAEMKIVNLKKVEIPLPPLSLQRQFASFVAQVDKLEFAAKRAMEKFDLLYRSKLQEHFG